MKIIEHYKKSFAKDCVNFKGRTSRTEYGTVALAHFLLFSLSFLPLLCYKMCLKGTSIFAYPLFFTFIFPALYFLVAFLPRLALKVRRAHDLGFSSWNLFCCYIPFLLFIVFGMIFLGKENMKGLKACIALLATLIPPLTMKILLLTAKGQNKPNKYGPVPSEKP